MNNKRIYLSSSSFQRSLTLNESNEISSSMILSSHSRASDTSSAYSGSDIMQSSTNGDEPLMNNHDTDEESEDSDDVRVSLFYPWGNFRM